MELKAKLASETSEEMMARIDAEQAIEDILVELSDSRGFRIVEDYRYATGEEQKDTDFIIQVEDIELRLIVKYSASGAPTLSRDDLGDLTEVLQGTQGTTALVLVWAAPELPTLIVTPADIELLLSREELVPAFLEATCELKEAVLRFVDSQTKKWRFGVVSGSGAGAVLPETQAILEQRLREEVEEESKRAYRLERKVLAQRTLTAQDAAAIARVFEEGRRAAKDARAISQDLIEMINKWERVQEE